MANLIPDTELQPLGPDLFAATLNPEWHIWGPMGGYLASLALRAAQRISRLPGPVSISCQFLAVAYFEPVEIRVTTLTRSRRSEAFVVSIHQGGRHIMHAQIWAHAPLAVAPTGSWHQAPSLPPPHTLPALEDAVEEEGGLIMPAWLNCFEVRVGGVHGEGLDRPARDPIVQGWTRMREPYDWGQDPWQDACRTLIVIDLVQYPAVTQGFPARDLTFIAPSMDLYVAFHEPAPAEEWLLVDGLGTIAGNGLASARAQVWSSAGALLATATQQMLIRPA
jgi:acyl-CoA thioesterase